jgi:hypothetical protein
MGRFDRREKSLTRKGMALSFLSKSLVAPVITQLFSDMIGKGVQRGYVFVGKAIIFLHIPDYPSMVYYHLSIPSMDLQEDDENRLSQDQLAQFLPSFLAHSRWHHRDKRGMTQQPASTCGLWNTLIS